MSIEAMKRALEALKGNCTNPVADPEQAAAEDKAITALRQAIAQAEKQQALDKKADNARELGLDYEPVAWIQEDRIVPELGYDCTMTREHPKELGYAPLYTAPPQAKKQTHTDHPMRHWDRTCPACVEQTEKQEPVAWWNGENSGDEGADFMYPESIPDRSIGSKHTKILQSVWHIPLYTAPPRKEWVGLTDEEIKNILDCGREGLIDIKKAEQILKDKNT